jgi:hypothetical protein
VAAQGIDGTYDGLGCAAQFRSEVSVTVAWPTLNFYESVCTITGGELVPGMAETYSYTASCNGEGESFTRNYVIVPNFEGGIVIVQDGFGQSYERCGG